MMLVISRDAIGAEAIADCSAPGQDAAEACDYWMRRLDFAAILQAAAPGASAEDIADQIRDCLRSTGAWEDEELEDDDDNRRRVFWMACCSMREGDPDYCIEG